MESGLDRLVTLDISSNKLSDASLARLGEWPGLKNVAHLRLGNNRKVSSQGYDALVESAHFAPSVLDIGKCNDQDLLNKLTERFGSALKTA